MMIILQTSAEGRRYRQPLANVHGVVLFVVIPPVSKVSSMSPVVLNHIDPQRKKSNSHPHHQRKLQRIQPTSIREKTEGLRKDCKKWGSQTTRNVRDFRIWSPARILVAVAYGIMQRYIVRQKTIAGKLCWDLHHGRNSYDATDDDSPRRSGLHRFRRRYSQR